MQQNGGTGSIIVETLTDACNVVIIFNGKYLGGHLRKCSHLRRASKQYGHLSASTAAS